MFKRPHFMADYSMTTSSVHHCDLPSNSTLVALWRSFVVQKSLILLVTVSWQFILCPGPGCERWAGASWPWLVSDWQRIPNSGILLSVDH